MRPTGHQTITFLDNKMSRGRAFRDAQEGDTYVDKLGKHWECKGTMTGETVHFGPFISGPSMYAERGIPLDADVKYATSYTKRVVDELEAAISPYGRHMSGQEARAAAQAAINLLKQYHRDLHVPYQQRDEARANLEEAKRAWQRLEAIFTK